MKTKINSTYPKHDAEFFVELIRQANKGAEASRLLRTFYPKQFQMTFENGDRVIHGTAEVEYVQQYQPYTEEKKDVSN